MKKSAFISTLFLFSCLMVFGKGTFTLASKTLRGNSTTREEFNGFGCTGENVSPQLSWQNAPRGTKSFAITMYDSDAPTGSGWWHWVVFNIPHNINNLVENAGNILKGLMPEQAVQSITNYGVPGYGGPCPPQNHGIHEYIITVYALKVDKLQLTKDTNPATVGYHIWNNTLAKASIVTYFERK